MERSENLRLAKFVPSLLPSFSTVKHPIDRRVSLPSTFLLKGSRAPVATCAPADRVEWLSVITIDCLSTYTCVIWNHQGTTAVSAMEPLHHSSRTTPTAPNRSLSLFGRKWICRPTQVRLRLMQRDKQQVDSRLCPDLH